MEIQLKDRISHGFSLIDQFTKYFSSLDISVYQYYNIIDKYIYEYNFLILSFEK